MARRRRLLPTERVLTAIGAVATLLTLMALFVAAGFSFLPATSPPAPSPTATGSARTGSPSSDPFGVEVGDCLDESTGSGELTSVPVVDCAEPHLGEAYASVRMDGGSAFPGADAVAQAARGCEAPFEQFVGRPLARSTLRVTYLHPTEQSWTAGDREILCVVADPAGPVTGSLRGAAR